MKLKDRAKVKGAKSAPRAGLRMTRGGANKAAGHKLMGQAEMIAGRLEPYAEGARDAVAHRAADAWEWAEPRLEHAAETAQHTYEKDIAPRVSTALTTAAERSEPMREEAMERALAALAALKGEPAKKKRRWPLALLFFFIGGAIGAAGGMLGKRFMPEATASAHSDVAGGQSSDDGRTGAHGESAGENSR